MRHRRRTGGFGSPPDPRFHDLIEGLIGRGGIEHAVMTVESGDRSLCWSGATGRSRPAGEPMRVDTPFFIASIDKLLTATVIMQLRERGWIDLEESIASYLPAELIAGLHRLDGVDRTNAITVRNLLGHSSGLADFVEDRRKGDRSLVEKLVSEGDRSWEIGEALQIARALPPHFPPQSADFDRPKVRYCDTNYLLLIALAQAVTGKPIHEVYAEGVWRPLGLRHTYLEGFSGPVEPTQPAAALWFGSEVPDVPLALRSLLSVYSTTADLVTFLRGFVSGELFSDPAAPALMQRRWNRFAPPRDRAALRAPSWPIEYGLGIMRFRLPRPFTPFRPVPAVVGHSGSTGSWLFHCPELDVYLAGSVDQGTAGAVPYRLVPRVLRELETAATR